MPGEPLAFVYSALLTDLPARVAPILQARPESAAEESRATTAAFYSINSAHKGLQGLDLGAILIKGAMQRLQAELPALRVFATLSPVPGFASWLRATADPRAHDAVAALARDLAPLPLEVPAPLVSGASLSMTSTVQARVTYKLSHSHMGDPWLEHPGVQRMLSRLCAYYLLHAKRHTHVLDPVGHFHLRNGACLERINSLGDVSAKGLAESFGVMVNYVYSGQDLAANAERYTRQGIVVASAQVEALAAEVAI
jgi:malonyl-CoA decarboxylase